MILRKIKLLIQNNLLIYCLKIKSLKLVLFHFYKLGKQFVHNLLITEEFSFENEKPLNTFFPKELVPPEQKKGLKIKNHPPGFIEIKEKKRSIFYFYDFIEV